MALPEPPSSTTVAIIYLGLLTESTPTNHEVLFLSPEFCAVPVFPPTSLTLLPRIEKEACAVPPSLVTELRSLSKKLTKYEEKYILKNQGEKTKYYERNLRKN